MKLNQNSIQAKIYRWFYGVKTMPQSLCPYFWKLMFMWVTILPFTLLSLPSFIWKSDEHVGIKMIGSLFMYVGLLFLFMMGLGVASIFGLTLEDGSLLYKWRTTGIFLWVITIVICIYFAIKYVVEYIEDHRRKYHKEYVYEEIGGKRIPTGRKYYYDKDDYTKIYIENKPNLIIEMIKAKYNKYCPKITWE
jgi:hypothetical protein